MDREPVYSVTSARSSQRDELGGRERRYVIAMGIRTVCFVGAVVAWQTVGAWLGAILFVGALVLQNKQCRNCHALDGHGGRRGPELDGVATRQTRDQLIRQVIQGSGNMPAYGKNLSPAEVNALVAFLQTLRPAKTVPARPAVDPRPAAR